MFDPTQLDQVNDVIQRYGFSDKRKRNEAMRSGMENPGAFQEQNAGYIQEAQQPSEYMGAGRKLAANQNPDSSIASLFQGNLTKHGNEWYSYGDNDYSTAQFGTNGYNLNSLGSGIYDIMGKDNTSLGKYYTDPGSAVNEIWNARGATTQDEYGNSIAMENPYRNTGGGALEDWENLGMILAGRTPDWNSATNSHVNRFYSQDNATQHISGLNTLYGSQPLIHNNKLLGYNIDLNPNNASGWGADRGNDLPVLARIDNNGKTQSSSQIWRDLYQPEEWGKYGQLIGDDSFFTTPDKVENLPGWLNKESRAYHQQKSSGLGKLGGIMKVLGSILSFTPLAPLGYAMTMASAMDSLSHGNTLGGLASLFSMGMGLSGADMAGAAGVDQAVGGGFSGADLVDFTTPSSMVSSAFGNINPSLMAAGVGAVGSKLAGQNPLIGALGSGLGNFAGGQLNKLFDGNVFGKIVGGGANTGIKSLFNQNKEIHGSEQAGRSGGLNAFLNATPTTADTTQVQPDDTQQQQAENLRRRIQLAQLQGRM